VDLEVPNRFIKYISYTWQEALLIVKVLVVVVILFILLHTANIISFYISFNSGGLETISGTILWYSLLGLGAFLPLLFVLVPVCFIMSFVKLCEPANGVLTTIAIAAIMMSFECDSYVRDKVALESGPESLRCVAHGIVSSRALKEFGLKLSLLRNDKDLVFTQNWREQFLEPNSIRDIRDHFVSNSELLDRKLSQIPDNVVVIFESDVPRGNVVGGPNDISTWWHYGKGSLMVFGDGRVEFVKKENFKDLRWQP
jgi:hypothetical protein